MKCCTAIQIILPLLFFIFLYHLILYQRTKLRVEKKRALVWQQAKKDRTGIKVRQQRCGTAPFSDRPINFSLSLSSFRGTYRLTSDGDHFAGEQCVVLREPSDLGAGPTGVLADDMTPPFTWWDVESHVCEPGRTNYHAPFRPQDITK